MARPRLKIDPEMVRQLAMIQCSYAEMGAVLKCSHDTLERRFASVIKQGWEEGKSSLKRAQYKAAMNGNPTMLIWLGKQHLGQKDQIESEVTTINTLPIVKLYSDRDVNAEHARN